MMLAHGYSDIHSLTIYKPQNNTTGMDWIYVTELMVLGYKGGLRECQVTFFENNPLTRHNCMFSHKMDTKLKYAGTDQEVNTTQTNPGPASCIDVRSWHQCAGDWCRLRQ